MYNHSYNQIEPSLPIIHYRTLDDYGLPGGMSTNDHAALDQSCNQSPSLPGMLSHVVPMSQNAEGEGRGILGDGSYRHRTSLWMRSIFSEMALLVSGLKGFLFLI